MSTLPIVLRDEAIERGLPRYFTGRPCKRGHIVERFTMNAACIKCMNERSAKVRDDIRAKRQAAEAG